MNEQRAIVRAQVLRILEDLIAEFREQETGMRFGDEMKAIGAEIALSRAVARVLAEISIEGDER